MSQITLIGKSYAEVGKEFYFVGPLPDCDGCKLKGVCFGLDDPADVGNLISGSSAFSKTSLNIRKFTVHILLKPGLENIEYYFTSM